MEERLYYYFNATPATVNGKGTWSSPSTLTLTTDDDYWTRMGTGDDPGFSAEWLEQPTEFGWVLAGTTKQPKGGLYMDDFSSSPTPASVILVPIALVAALCARRYRER